MNPVREALRRLSSLVNRVVLVKAENDHKNQKWLVNGVEEQDKEIEIFELYGLTSRPRLDKKAEVLRFSLEGFEDHTIAFGASGGDYRPLDARQDEVILYAKWDKGSKHRIQFHDEKQGISLMAGNNRLTLDNEKLVIEIGDNRFVIDNEKMESVGDGEFNGVSVSKHTHGGVEAGSASTDGPG